MPKPAFLGRWCPVPDCGSAGLSPAFPRQSPSAGPGSLPPFPAPAPWASQPGPPPHRCAHRTLTLGHIQSTGAGSVPESGAAQKAWCWPGGHMTRSSLERHRSLTHLLARRDCAVPFCLCNINTDFYTSPLWLPVLSITMLDSPPPLQVASPPSPPCPRPLLSGQLRAHGAPTPAGWHH